MIPKRKKYSPYSIAAGGSIHRRPQGCDLRFTSFLLPVIFFVVVRTAGAQSGDKSNANRDTSFTTHSAAAKVLREFPSAKLVTSEMPATVSEEADVVYDSSSGRQLKLDIYYPAKRSDSPVPGVLMIHGGGWSSGDRSMQAPMAVHIADYGYVAATVEYRLTPEAKYPAAIHDLKSAVRWMRANAGKYNIDTNKIAAYGCSSGGELAAFLGTTGGISKFEGDGSWREHSSSVEAVIDVDGLLDFTNVSSTRYDTSSVKPSAADRWFGGSYKAIPQVWEEASPIRYISDHTPPIIFINSALPHYHAGRDATISKLNEYGIYFEIHTIPDTPHPFWLFHPWFEETFNFTCAFLDRVFK